ncbi:MAG TPA: alpha-L-arabinofuranosidase C-terminal domain-containing protein, partial [Puia sp.]|nr:alpha-L-arabinofuranosidase C-terminal domain-containing protein [Puia sp.]
DWMKYTCTLIAGHSDPRAQFVLSFGGAGSLWLDFVSLFPEKTFKGRPNGLRADLAQYIADLHPSFVRWPGGCFVEGINIENAPDWKHTLGPIEKRPGTYSPWGYWSSDGFGYHEYLQFCEDIGAAALYVFNAGVSCEFRSGTFTPDDSLGPVIQNALDAIEYAVGPTNSRWGRVRASNGHPAPFPLKYVEVGNEQHGPRYARRYNRFYTAIREKYPGISIIASMGIADVNRNTLDSMQQVDITDEHAYKGAGWSFTHYDHFDKYKRGKWDMYVGEYATNGGVGKGNMAAALGDAVYLMAMERNSDLVKMSSYAPLLVNVNDESWPVNLINFDAGNSFARISYYAIRMFNENKPDINLETTIQMQPAADTAKTYCFSGGIGLATWDTQSEYKDMEVQQNGQVVYKADLINHPADWQSIRGDWTIGDSAVKQSAAGAQLLALLKDRTFDTYTLTLKARKIDGYNAFIIPFAVKDSNDCLRAHIGSYVNSHCVFEKVTGGYEVTDLTDQRRMKQPIEKNRWYAIRLEVQPDKVDCYLDGELLMTYKQPDRLFAISGRDEKTGDIIVKMVNTGGTPVTTAIQIAGNSRTDNKAILTTLAAERENAENSFEYPTAHIPVQSEDNSNALQLSLKPYSVNVLRIKK